MYIVIVKNTSAVEIKKITGQIGHCPGNIVSEKKLPTHTFYKELSYTHNGILICPTEIVQCEILP